MGDSAVGRAMAAGVDVINEVRAGGAKVGAAQMLARMSAAAFGPDDPDTLFMVWMGENAGRLAEACAELGVTVEPGPRFAHRLRDAVAPILAERRKV